MFKNKEVKWLLLAAVVLLGISVAVGYFNPEALLVILIFDIAALTFLYISATIYRMKKIKRLTEYLYELADGKRDLLLDDYREGELSLLQSEIYKLAVRLTEQAELLNRDKTYLADAISDISHQLKTPVTSMRVMADLLGDGHLPDEKRRSFTANIQNQLNRMEWLVTALLKMAKLDAGAVTMKKEAFTVEALICSATEHLLIPMELKNIDFCVSGDLSAKIEGDIGWLSEAAANILKNCIEHTPNCGKITVQAEQTALYMRLEISDTGNGISDEDLPHIFERFYKGHNSSPESVGIGLAMAKQIIHEMNGNLAVTKTGTSGTTFVIKIYKK